MMKRKFAYVFVFCSLFILAMVIGFSISNFGKISYDPLVIIVCLLAVSLLSALVTLLILKIKIIPIKFKNYENLDKILKNKYILFSIIFLSFIPAFLAYFPSIWSYDISTQVDQIFVAGYSRYHPLLHTLMIDICLKIGMNLFKSYTMGAMIYSLMQMGILSACITYALRYVFNRFELSTIFRVLMILFYVILPFNAIMAISTTKDTIFAGLTIVVVIKLFDICDRKYELIDKLKFVLLIILWFAFRNNAYFAFIAFAILMIFMFWKSKKLIVFWLVIIILCNFTFNFCLDKILDAESISSAEIISVPGSQIAKAAIYNIDKFTDDEIQMLDEVFEGSYVNYNPYLFDDIKLEMNFNVGKLSKLLILWAKLLPKCLPDYIDAFLCLNVGSWYPLDETYTRIYIDDYFEGELMRGTLVDRHQGYLQTLQAGDLELQFQNFFPAAYKYYESICSLNMGQDNLITQIILSPASYLWSIIGLLFYFIYKKDKNKMVPLILLLLYWCTTLLGPCTLFRYMYPIVITYPICISLINEDKKGRLDEKQK